jgi:hypothetical protein
MTFSTEEFFTVEFFVFSFKKKLHKYALIIKGKTSFYTFYKYWLFVFLLSSFHTYNDKRKNGNGPKSNRR